MGDLKRGLLTYGMVAQRFGVPIGTVYSMKSRGQLPFVKLGRRLIRFDEDVIEKWLAERQVPSKGSER